jgi:hypothetical protein
MATNPTYEQGELQLKLFDFPASPGCGRRVTGSTRISSPSHLTMPCESHPWEAKPEHPS